MRAPSWVREEIGWALGDLAFLLLVLLFSPLLLLWKFYAWCKYRG